jgi:magnesium transporter
MCHCSSSLVPNRLTEASRAQNEEVKTVSAGAAILFAPTLIGTICGMNFAHMPERDWMLGHLVALLLMLVTCVGLYVIFKRRGRL